jgi:hypothetical protein
LGGTFVDIEICRITAARRQRMPDQHDTAAIAQQRPTSFRGMRLRKHEKTEKGRRQSTQEKILPLPPYRDGKAKRKTSCACPFLPAALGAPRSGHHCD